MGDPARKLRRDFGRREGDIGFFLCALGRGPGRGALYCGRSFTRFPRRSQGIRFLQVCGERSTGGRPHSSAGRPIPCAKTLVHQSPALTRAPYIPPLRLPIVNSGRRDTDDQADLRRAGPGRARPCLFLSCCGRRRACSGRSRHRAARPARLCRRRVGRAGCARSATRQPAQGYHQPARYSAAAGGAAPLHRLGRRLHAVAARHGAADGAAHGRIARPRARTHRGADRGATACPHDRGAGAGSGAARRRPAAEQERGGRTGERFAERD